jgi:hypothetical protein
MKVITGGLVTESVEKSGTAGMLITIVRDMVNDAKK